LFVHDLAGDESCNQPNIIQAMIDITHLFAGMLSK
jgi:hypothetical protein